MVGPDGKLYPAWHPPTVINPATGERCSFGHEHGANPRGSDIYDWVATELAAPAFTDRAGIPFGYASERLADSPRPTRVRRRASRTTSGHKIDFADDVTLLDSDGHYVTRPIPPAAARSAWPAIT